jgi:hypothetical protein
VGYEQPKANIGLAVMAIGLAAGVVMAWKGDEADIRIVPMDMPGPTAARAVVRDRWSALARGQGLALEARF